jgi:uncharacterized protein (UPF0548 family)
MRFFPPSPAAVSDFLRRQEGEDFSYPDRGASQKGFPAGFDVDHNEVLLGRGRAVFEAARAALREWKMFPSGWTRVEPPGAPIREGGAVAVLFRVFGLWWLNASRIVYILDEERCFGFAYGTLPAHIESGEELFRVEWRADGTVWYDIRGFSRPRLWMVRLGYPVARWLQRRFVRESKAAMVAVVGSREPP